MTIVGRFTRRQNQDEGEAESCRARSSEQPSNLHAPSELAHGGLWAVGSFPAKRLTVFLPWIQKPFTLVQEVVLEGTPQAQAAFRGKNAVTVSGALEYQACDDKICYNPTTVPLSWTLNLRPIIFERTPAP